MRLALHAVVCCCVFTSVLPPAGGTAGELNTSLKKRFKVWLQSRVRRDLCSGAAAAHERLSDVRAGPLQDEDPKGASPPSSCAPRARPGRSTSGKPSGCKFVTCVYHDLLHRLHQINEVKSCAPSNKIGSKGYGRRRRRRRRALADAARLALRTGRKRRSPEAASKVSLAAEMQETTCRPSLKEPED